VFNNNGLQLDLYGDNVEVDYRGYEVTVESFIRVLTGRHDTHVPRSKRLLTDDRSNVFIFMTGHGGDDFLKFQDAEEIGAQDIADAIGQMFEKKRYNELLFMIDTCQAATMYSKITSPNVLACASSLKGESSYSHHASNDIGVAVIDRFTFYNLETLEKIDSTSKETMKNLFDTYNPSRMLSTPGIRTDLFPRAIDKVSFSFFT
jgi:phosphatidylinositol glycan class K